MPKTPSKKARRPARTSSIPLDGPDLLKVAEWLLRRAASAAESAAKIRRLLSEDNRDVMWPQVQYWVNVGSGLKWAAGLAKQKYLIWQWKSSGGPKPQGIGGTPMKEEDCE